MVKFLGICPFLGVSKQVETAIGMGLAVTFVMAVASAATYIVQELILIPLGIEYMQTIAFIPVSYTHLDVYKRQVLSTIRYFRDEYEAHIRDKKCPAGVCQALLSYVILKDKCKACGICAKKCPVNCISGKPKTPYEIDQDQCIKCGTCMEACPFGAIIKA